MWDKQNNTRAILAHGASVKQDIPDWSNNFISHITKYKKCIVWPYNTTNDNSHIIICHRNIKTFIPCRVKINVAFSTGHG